MTSRRPRVRWRLRGSAPVATVRRREAAKGPIDDELDGELFEKLRALRKSIADAEKVPAYIVFSDAVLRAMAATQPATERELLAISGIGPVKLERYGTQFLEALRIER